MVVLPYVSGVSEKLARIFKKRKISSAKKPNTKLRALLVHPKVKTDPKEGVYTIDCTGCEKKYVGETKRKLQVRVKEHPSHLCNILQRLYAHWSTGKWVIALWVSRSLFCIMASCKNGSYSPFYF